MIKQLILLGAICFLLIDLQGCSKTNNKEQVVELISVEEMDSLLQLDKVQLIDVRTPEEFATGHIPGAINIDYRDPNFKQMLTEVDKSKPVAVYCKKGGRSNACSKIMRTEGFVKVFDLNGGISQWVFKGKNVVK